MIVNGYLVVSASGSLKVTKTKPNLDWNQIAISIHLNVPDALFQKPTIHAEIIIREEDAAPMDITADVVNNVQDAFLQNTGFELRILQPEPKETNN